MPKKTQIFQFYGETTILRWDKKGENWKNIPIWSNSNYDQAKKHFCGKITLGSKKTGKL